MLRETHLTAQEETIDKFQFIVHFPLLFIGTQKVIESKKIIIYPLSAHTFVTIILYNQK